MNSSSNRRVNNDRRGSDPAGSKVNSRTPTGRAAWSGPHYGSDRIAATQRPVVSYGSYGSPAGSAATDREFERAPSEITVNSDSFSPVRSPIPPWRNQHQPNLAPTTPIAPAGGSSVRSEPDSAIRESFEDIQKYLHRPYGSIPSQPTSASIGYTTPGPSPSMSAVAPGYASGYPPPSLQPTYSYGPNSTPSGSATVVPNGGQQAPLPLASVIGRYTAPTPSHYGGTGGSSIPATASITNWSQSGNGAPAHPPTYSSQPPIPSGNLGYNTEQYSYYPVGSSTQPVNSYNMAAAAAAPAPTPGLNSSTISQRNPIPSGESSWSLLLKGPLMSQQPLTSKVGGNDQDRPATVSVDDPKASSSKSKKEAGNSELSSSVDPMSKSPRRLSRRRPIPSDSEDDATNQTAPTVNLTDDSNAAFIQIVWYLRRRYGDQEAKAPIPPGSEDKHPSRYELSSLTDEDCADLGFLFVEEVKSLARKQRAKKGIPEPLPEPTAEEKSRRALDKKLKDMTVRDAVAELRLGGNFTKFGRRGTPSVRYIFVSDRRTLHKGEMVAMPHLCWAVDSKAEPSGQLPLFELKELETGPSDTMKKNAEGFVIGVLNETFSDKQCITLVFSSRTIDIACKNLAQLAIWKRALYLIIYKNRELLAAAQRNSK